MRICYINSISFHQKRPSILSVNSKHITEWLDAPPVNILMNRTEHFGISCIFRLQLLQSLKTSEISPNSQSFFQCPKGKRDRLVLVVRLLVVTWGRGSRTSNYNWLEQNKSRGREGKGGGAIVGFALSGAQPLSVQSTFVFCNGLLVMLCNGLLLMQSVYLLSI